MTEWNWKGLWIGFPKAERRFLLVFVGGALLAMVAAIGGWFHRYDFSEALVPFAFQEEQIEAVREVTLTYRTYLLEAPVRWVYEVQAADLLVPSRWGYVLAWVAVVLGWGALLTATTRMQGFWPYLLYFAWVSWVYLSGVAQAWAGQDPFYVVSLGVSLVSLLPAYLIQSGVVRLSIRQTALLLTSLVGLSLGIPALWRGIGVLHDGVAYPGILSIAATLGLFLQAAVSMGAVGVYVLARLRKGIQAFMGMAVLFMGIALLLFFLPQESAFSLSIVLVAIGVGLGFIGLQPFYPVFAAAFRQPIAFFWGYVGLVLIAFAPLAYHAVNHQDLYIYRAAALARSALVGGLFAMVVYLALNFWPLWRARKMSFWLLHQSARVPLALVYFTQVIAIVISEAYNDWPTSRLPARLYAVLRAESALVRGDWTVAQAAYQEAATFLPYEAKANYNLGRLEAQDPRAAGVATERYERALLAKPFLPAALQASLVALAMDRPVQAIQLLQRYYHHFGGGAVVCNQLAFAFYKGGFLDSAAFYWKEAIRQDPSNPQYYLHLALLYARYGRLSWAQKVARHALTLRPQSQSALENLAYLRLVGVLDTLPPPAVPLWNAQWLGIDNKGDSSKVGQFVASVQRRQFKGAFSFLPYFEEQDKELAPKLTRYLGVALLEEGLTRVAAEVFFRAGTPQDSLYGAYALADAGCLDAAYSVVSRLWVSYPEIEEAGRKEAALLLAAAGHLNEASLLEPVGQWKDADYLRFGWYGYHRGSLNEMVIVLRPWIEQGARYDAPYEWVARLFLLQGDTAGAEENLAAGLARVPRSVRLWGLRAEIALARQALSEARRCEDSVWAYARSRSDSLVGWGIRLRRDPSPEGVQACLKAYPAYAPAIAAWGRHLLRQGKKEEAFTYLGQALDINPYAKELWEAYAAAAQAMGMTEEAEFARKKPDPCPPAL